MALCPFDKTLFQLRFSLRIIFALDLTVVYHIELLFTLYRKTGNSLTTAWISATNGICW